ncbi:hypothetical protein [Nocardia sp. NPDC050710]|uniref:hypothetical protein n=1 Tax=Nocardia sp. NPDC050710 TaxID=3157220 RepID=UPI0034005D85
MTTAAARPSPVWVSLEGPEAVGKTRLARHLARLLAPRCRLLDEVTDATGRQVPALVLAALAGGGDPFLRNGFPRTETVALMGLVVRQQEVVDQIPVPPAVVVEDRGIDSVAIYQAAIMLGPDADDEQTWALAQQLLATVTQWRTRPDLTVLLVDDLDICAARWAQREGSPLTSEQRHLVARATRLYRRQAETESSRYRVVDRAGLTEPALISCVESLIEAAESDRRN